MSPQISIVMPTYNRNGIFLKEAVSSVLNQTFNNFELIIIDDASIDNTEELIISFSDPRIRYYKTDHNHGEYWSTNYGVNLAKSAYLTWIHSDDILPKDSLSLRFIELENNKKLDFVHGDIVKIDQFGKEIEKVEAVDWPKEKIIYNYLLPEDKKESKYLIHHTTIMMKWNFFYKAGPFDSSLAFAGDIDWLIRAIRVGNFKYIPKTLYNYRSHKDSRRIIDIQNGIDKNEINSMIIRRYKED